MYHDFEMQVKLKDLLSGNCSGLQTDGATSIWFNAALIVNVRFYHHHGYVKWELNSEPLDPEGRLYLSLTKTIVKIWELQAKEYKYRLCSESVRRLIIEKRESYYQNFELFCLCVVLQLKLKSRFQVKLKACFTSGVELRECSVNSLQEDGAASIWK